MCPLNTIGPAIGQRLGRCWKVYREGLSFFRCELRILIIAFVVELHNSGQAALPAAIDQSTTGRYVVQPSRCKAPSRDLSWSAWTQWNF